MKVSFDIDEELYKKIQRTAKCHGRSAASEIRRTLNQACGDSNE